MKLTIWWDMDGTIANLYGVPNWLELLRAENEAPYMQAEVMHNMAQLAKLMNKLQKKGYQIGIISWLSKTGSDEYNEKVTITKQKWLHKHLKSVKFDEIHIVKYGTPKQNFAHSSYDILFDDEEKNRNAWTGIAYEPHEMFSVMRCF